MVLGDDRRVTGRNPAAARMLGPALGSDATCCRVFGCRRPGTPLADGCITLLALDRERPMPEIRIDLAEGGECQSVWLIAAPIGIGPSSVLASLRPGVAGDRRRRTEPHWIDASRLRIYTLGRTRVESREGPIAGEWLGHRPGEVLKYLVVNRGRQVPLEELADVFWPTASGRSATSSVRQAIHALRDRLEPERRKHEPSPFIVARKGGYELGTSHIWIDADEFEDQLRIGLDALAAGQHGVAEGALTRALALEHGEFLADEPYADWTLAERDRLRDAAAAGLRALSTLRHEQGDLPGAIEHLGRLAELQPLDLEVQEELLRLMLRDGRSSQAMRRLDIVRRRYRRAFGQEPALDLGGLVDAQNRAS